MTDSTISGRPERKPNIIYLFNDQHRHDVLGCAGNPVAVTPNLDSLAAQGVRFTNTWCASPVCRPSRGSVITAAHPHQHGCVGNQGDDFDPDWPTMMKSLQKAGYRTGHVGKSHYHQPKFMQLLAEGKTLDTRSYEEYVGSFGFDDVFEEFDRYVHFAPHVSTPYKDFLAEHGALERYQSQIESVWRGTPTHWEGQTSVIPQELDLTRFISDRAIDWVDSVDASQPFFLQLSFVAPHVPLIADPEWAARFADVDIPRGPGDVPSPTNEVWGDYIESLQAHAQAGVHDDDYLLAGARQYYAMVSLIDQCVGDLLATLRRRDLLDDTWIVFSADHGEMLGDHYLMAKMGFYRSSVQIPAIVRPPKCANPGVVDTVVSAVDLTATILDIAGADQIPDAAGRSLLPALSGESIAEAPVFSTIQRVAGGAAIPVGAPPADARLFVATTDGYQRFTIEATTFTPCELFDLDADPDENHNLVAHPDHLDDVARHSDVVSDFLANPGPISR